MTEGKPFNIDLGRLKTREKDRSPQALEKVDRAGEELGSSPARGRNGADAGRVRAQARFMPRSCPRFPKRSPTRPSAEAFNRG